MTLLNIRAQLINHFCHCDTFKVSDFTAIGVGKGLESHKDGLIRAALDELAFAGLIRPIPASGKKGASSTPHPEAALHDLWILSSPLNSAGQDIHLSMGVANGIAETINTWLNANDLPGDRVDPMSLNEGHIIAILEILDDVLSTDPIEQDRPVGGDSKGAGGASTDEFRGPDSDLEDR